MATESAFAWHFCTLAQHWHNNTDALTHGCSYLYFPRILFFFILAGFRLTGKLTLRMYANAAYIPKTTFRAYYTATLNRRIRESERERWGDWVPNRDKTAANEANQPTARWRIVLHGEKSKTQLRLLWGKVFLQSNDRAIQRSTEGTRNRRGLGLGLNRSGDRLSAHIALGPRESQPLWVSISNQLILFWFFWAWLHDDCRLLRPVRVLSLLFCAHGLQMPGHYYLWVIYARRFCTFCGPYSRYGRNEARGPGTRWPESPPRSSGLGISMASTGLALVLFFRSPAIRLPLQFALLEVGYCASPNGQGA